MRLQSFVFALVALAICIGAKTRTVLAQEEENAVGSDTTKQVIVNNNYYYGGYPYPAYVWYPPYPRYHGYYYSRVFVGSAFAPFRHRYYSHRFRPFYGHGFGRNFGYNRGPGIGRGGRGWSRY